MQRLRHPIRAIREPFGKAGLTVAVIALVFAMVGGAFAAAGLNGKQKKEVKAIAKSFAGKPGAPGAAGTNGTNGKDGAPGAPGAPGADGKSVTEEAATPAECGGVAGGVKYTLQGGNTTIVCNGKNGTTGFTDTLPAGKTETGMYQASELFSTGFAAVSFPIPLASGLGEAQVHQSGEAGFATACPGDYENPTVADNSNLCVYLKTGTGTVLGILPSPTSFTPGATKTGAFVAFSDNNNNSGSWAVKGP